MKTEESAFVKWRIVLVPPPYEGGGRGGGWNIGMLQPPSSSPP